jgi:tyrosine-protein kinase Etk/Wzc
MQITDINQVHRISAGEDNIDLKTIFNKLGAYWYWFIISAFIGLIVAFFYCKYTPPIYKINSKVLITDPSKSGGGLGKEAGALMDLGGIMNSGSSVDNEAEALKTPDLLEEVVRELKLNVVYGQKINFVTREMYQSPFVLNVIKGVDTIAETQFQILKLVDGKVKVTTKDFDKEVAWGENFNVSGVGTLQLIQNPGTLMNNLKYVASVYSIDERVSDLMKEMSISVSNKDVTVVDLTLNYLVPKKGEEVLTALINKYKESNLKDKNAIADSTYMFIRQRLNVIASELGDVETKVEKFKEANKLSDMSEQGKLLVQNTGEYSAELAKAETQVSVLTDLENYLKDETKNKRVFPTSLMPSDLVFSNLMSQYNALLADRDRTLMSVTAETPFVKNLDAQIAGLRNGILSNIQSTKNTYILTRNKLRSQLGEAQNRIQGVPQIEKNYLKLARNQQIKQELYIFLMQKAEETAISRTSNISIAKVLSRPKSELVPVSPKKSMVYIFGLVAGLIITLLTIVLKDLFDSTIKTKEDISNATKVPILGEISHNLVMDNLIVANNGRSAISEQFRALRANLNFYLKGRDQNVILITSSMSGEGKSFTAINLANIIAILGKKVLLMELDLRKPGLSSKLNIGINNNGFSNYIVDEKLKISDIVRPLDINENMFIIASGPLPPNPGELLMNERTASLIHELKSQFDYIIMDAPPIGIITDAQTLVNFADLTIYLVRQKFTEKNQLAIVDDLYRSERIKNIGIVVNDVMDKEYGYGYGYGNYETVEKSSWFSKLFKK